MISMNGKVSVDDSALKDKPQKPIPPLSHQVFQWPEFIAFAERLGIDLSKRTKVLTITFDGSKSPTIDHSYLAYDLPTTTNT